MSRKISIHQGLAELKLIEKRILKMNGFKCVGLKQHKETIVLDTNLTEEDFNKEVKSQYDSITALISRWQEIKNKIVLSNATTKATVAGKEMTIAEIIEYKNTIKDKKNLLDNLKYNYSKIIREKENRNIMISDKIDNRYSKNENNNSELIAKLREEDKKNEFFEIIDPINIKEEIKKIEKEVEDFESEVDFVLSRSNAITEIEVSD